MASMTRRSAVSLADILPIEVLQQIGPHLRSRDVANLRLASSHFSQIFAPFLINRLSLELTESGTIRKGPNRPSSFAAEVPVVPIPEALARYIRELSFCIYSGRNPYPPDSQEEQVQKEVAGLKSLKKLTIRQRSWQPKPETITRIKTVEQQILSVVMEGNQATLENLGLGHSHVFTQEAIIFSFPKPLSTFKELRFLHDDESFIPQLKEILSQTSVLESLRVGCSGEVQISLQDIFPPNSINPHLSLRNLSLEGAIGWKPNSSFSTMPSFTSLLSLTLALRFPSTPFDLDDFWDFLRATNVWLECLHLVFPVTPALIRYLNSFKGLRELCTTAEPAHGVAETDLGSIADVCQLHARTLANLSMVWLNSSEGESGEDRRSLPSTLSLFHPTVYSNLTCLLLTNIVSVEWFDGSAFPQDLLDWLEEFPVLNQVFTGWEVDGDYPHTFSVDNLTSRLVGRTGRPRYWKWHVYDEWDGRGITLGIQHRSEGGWYFAEIPSNPDFEENWGVFKLDYGVSRL